MAFNPQPPTAGALGTEGASSGKHRKRKGGDEHITPTKPDIVSNQPSRTAVPPIYEEAPWAPGFNLAGRPDLLYRSEMGVQKHQTKVTGLFRRGSLNNESYFHFVIKSDKYEWIRFRRESVSVLVYGQVRNVAAIDPAAQAYANATPEQKARFHALQARKGLPKILLDPDVSGTGFFHRIDVSINGVPVPTNSGVGNLLLQSVRLNRLLGKDRKADDHFCRTRQMVWPDAADIDTDIKRANAYKSGVMKRATAPFDYNTPLSQTGVLIPIFMDGVFPFDFKCQLMESVDNAKEPNLYFPPDTEIEIKMHLYRHKIEALFLAELDMTNYFDVTQINDGTELNFTFQDVHLEYESVLLQPHQQTVVMDQFAKGGKGFYDYDIIRGQHQSLPTGASYTQNDFQIMPWCRLFVVLFLNDWATFPMEAKKRPLSGFSRYPHGCSNLRLHYAGQQNLIFEQGLQNFGFRGETHQISKKSFHDYLTAHRFTSFDFDEFFPKDAADQSLIQFIPYDARSLMSDKTEKLSVVCEFASGRDSPANMQVCVISFHPNGRAIVSAGSSNYSWIWEFKQSV